MTCDVTPFALSLSCQEERRLSVCVSVDFIHVRSIRLNAVASHDSRHGSCHHLRMPHYATLM